MQLLCVQHSLSRHVRGFTTLKKLLGGNTWFSYEFKIYILCIVSIQLGALATGSSCFFHNTFDICEFNYTLKSSTPSLCEWLTRKVVVIFKLPYRTWIYQMNRTINASINHVNAVRLKFYYSLRRRYPLSCMIITYNHKRKFFRCSTATNMSNHTKLKYAQIKEQYQVVGDLRNHYWDPQAWLWLEIHSFSIEPIINPSSPCAV